MDNSVIEATKYYSEPGKGRKLCNNCGKYVGIRLTKCYCGNVLNAELLAKMEARITEIKIIERYNEPGKGRKQCLKCRLYVGAKTTKCLCGHIFEAKEKEISIFDAPAEGLRQCVSCEKYIGNRYRECPNCGEKQEKLFKAKTHDDIHEEVVPCPPNSRIPGNPSKYKVIIIPSGSCPVNLVNSEPDNVAKWVENLLDFGFRKHIIYSLVALKYFVNYFHARETIEYKNICKLIDNHKFKKLYDDGDDN